jgi:hypothetical protein
MPCDEMHAHMKAVVVVVYYIELLQLLPDCYARLSSISTYWRHPEGQRARAGVRERTQAPDTRVTGSINPFCALLETHL